MATKTFTAVEFREMADTQRTIPCGCCLGEASLCSDEPCFDCGGTGIEPDTTRDMLLYAATLACNQPAVCSCGDAITDNRGKCVTCVSSLSDCIDDLRAISNGGDSNLRAFVRELFDASQWPEASDIEVDVLQDIAVKHGLLIPRTVTEPCGESCQCAEYNGDMSDGVTCYRKVEWLRECPSCGVIDHKCEAVR